MTPDRELFLAQAPFSGVDYFTTKALYITKIGCKSSFWLCYFLYSYLDNKFVYIVFIFTIFMVGCCGFVLFTWLRKVPKLNHSMYLEASPLTQIIFTQLARQEDRINPASTTSSECKFIYTYLYIYWGRQVACINHGRVSDTSSWESCLGDDSNWKWREFLLLGILPWNRKIPLLCCTN